MQCSMNDSDHWNFYCCIYSYLKDNVNGDTVLEEIQDEACVLLCASL